MVGLACWNCSPTCQTDKPVTHIQENCQLLFKSDVLRVAMTQFQEFRNQALENILVESKFTLNAIRVAINEFVYPAQTRERRSVIWNLVKQRLGIDEGRSCGNRSSCHDNIFKGFIIQVILAFIVGVYEGPQSIDEL